MKFEELPSDVKRLIEALGGELSKVPMIYAAPVYFANAPQQGKSPNINNGTGSLVAIGAKQFCITNYHVLSAYRQRKDEEADVIFQIGHIRLEPDDMLVSESQHFDLAVLDLSELNIDEIGSHGEVPTQFLQAPNWPPVLPSKGDFVMFGGYPGYWREQIGHAEIQFDTLSSGSTELHDAREDNIVCQLQVDKCIVHRAQAGRNEPGDLVGLSGGPVLREKRSDAGLVTFEFVGVIYEYNEAIDCLYIRPASLISEDGNIREPGL